MPLLLLRFSTFLSASGRGSPGSASRSLCAAPLRCPFDSLAPLACPCGAPAVKLAASWRSRSAVLATGPKGAQPAASRCSMYRPQSSFRRSVCGPEGALSDQ
eukprot:SAG11_NODE_811_length_7065_cov_2.641114_2_plen_102_part_00